MNNKTDNRYHNDAFKLQPLLDEREWDSVVKESKHRHQADLRRKEKIALNNIEYFKDKIPYDDPKGSDYDDYYS
ncbi:MAG: hypothetical protein V7782_02190 [Psychromonas sp.]